MRCIPVTMFAIALALAERKPSFRRGADVRFMPRTRPRGRTARRSRTEGMGASREGRERSTQTREASAASDPTRGVAQRSRARVV